MKAIAFPGKRGALRFLTGLAAGLVLATAATAQGYPSKAIRFIVPYPPGGGTDVVVRMIAPRMAQGFGQPVVIDNKPGASTVAGTDLLAKAPPDGYTIGLYTTFDPVFFPKLPFDPLKDFEPITQLVELPLVLVVRPSLNVKTVAELVALAKANPGKLNFASIGSGTPHQIAMEWLKAMAGISMAHIPYKGVAPALLDLVSGQVDVMFTGTSSAAPHVKAGKLVPLAVSSPKRQALFPNTPSVAESGYPDFDFVVWYGLAAPAGTPRDIVMRINKEVRAALLQPETQEKLLGMGVISAPSSPAEFAALVRAEGQKLNHIIRTSGVKPE
jgi:tripartite-type tricarboxylate transporter receptor subunit TctC